MTKDRYGEVKARKNFYPSDAKSLIEKGSVDILITQCIVSNKTKDILNEGKVTLYEGVEPHEVEKLLEKLKEPIEEEKIESEKGE